MESTQFAAPIHCTTVAISAAPGASIKQSIVPMTSSGTTSDASSIQTRRRRRTWMKWRCRCIAASASKRMRRISMVVESTMPPA